MTWVRRRDSYVGHPAVARPAWRWRPLQFHANVSQPCTPVMQLGQAERETVRTAGPRVAFQCVREIVDDRYELFQHVHTSVPADPRCKSAKQVVHVLRVSLEQRVKLVILRSYKTVGTNPPAPHAKHTHAYMTTQFAFGFTNWSLHRHVHTSSICLKH